VNGWWVASIVVALVLIVVAYWWFLYSPKPAPPELSAPLAAAKLIRSTGERDFHMFVPARIEKNATLLLVLHGSGGDASQMRRYTGYEFERLADEHGFIVAYPEGFGGYWNDARKKGRFPAKKLGIDDVGFLRDLIEHFRRTHHVGRVFAVGYSNGGHMCFRLALEAPDMIDGFAVFGANMPTDDNCICPPLTRPIRALFVNGTRDPINPYEGGRVTIFGFGDRGTVRSAVESAKYFAHQLGAEVERLGPNAVVPATPDSATWVDERAWRASSNGEVALFTVHDGGHVIPQPRYRFPRIVGRTEMRFNAPAACWKFFSAIATSM
jgi:polyhydroxybutyrate depolymerase